MPITLLIVGSGVCALWIGFQVIKDILTGSGSWFDSEVRNSLILATLGLISFPVAFLPVVLISMNPLVGSYALFGMCFIIIFYTLRIRSRVSRRRSRE